MHDMKVTIANHRNSLSFVELKKDKVEFKRNIEFSNNSTKEAMSIFKVELVRIMGEAKTGRENECFFQGCDKKASRTKRALGEEIFIS